MTGTRPQGKDLLYGGGLSDLGIGIFLIFDF